MCAEEHWLSTIPPFNAQAYLRYTNFTSIYIHSIYFY